MINVKSKRCEHDGCGKQPNYNYEGEKQARFCVKHALDGMIDVKSKRCEHDGCGKQPVYNYEGEKQARFCVKHALDGMVDVKNKRCEHDGCGKQPVYNYEGEKQARFCVKHALDGMVDVKNKRCKTPLCDTRPSDKYSGYCLRCYMYTFPDKPVAHNYKTKERAVADIVLEHFPEVDWIADKVVSGGCSRRRPDLLLELGHQVVICEIDENQHQDYDCSCENRRLMEISQDVGHRNIIFIRFNPDGYIDRHGKNVTSCWGQNGKGVCAVKKSKENEWAMRMKTLVDTIQYWCENKSDKLIEVVQLFFDEN
jgi:hypothetical protein